MTYELPDPQIFGWMSAGELQWLYETAKGMETIVEVGVWKGRSTHALCSGCRGHVIAVDHWKGSSAEQSGNHREATEHDVCQDFWKNVGHFRNLSVLRMESTQAASFFLDQSVDMVFIDGGHEFEEVLNDLRFWTPICKKLLCGHDLSYDSVKTALQRMNLKFEQAIDAIWRVNASDF